MRKHAGAWSDWKESNINQYKTCKSCRQTKPIKDFTRDKTRTDGLRENCKPCRAIKTKQWAIDNPGYRAKWLAKNPQYQTKWRLKNFWYTADRGAVERAKKLDSKIYSISKKDYKRLFQSRCVICGSEEQPTLDHIIPLSRGGTHSIGNLQILCLSCNSRKGNKTITEWKMSELRA